MNASHLTKPTVIVTGNTGLIGSNLSRALAADYTVYGLDVREPEPAIDGVQWIECDLTSDESVDAALKIIADANGPRVVSVVHLAAYYDFSGEPSPLYRELTVKGTGRLLRALKHLRVEQFIFSSSLLVMEPAEFEDDVITEQSPTQGEWDYPRSKLEAERVIRQEHGDTPAVILRIAGVYDEDCNSIPISQQIARIYEESLESHFFPGDVDRGQPFIHLDDVVECIRQTIERRADLDPFEVLLIAEDDLMSYEQLQNRIGELIHGDQWLTLRVPKAVAKAGAWVKDKLTPEEAFVKPWMIDLADDHYPADIAKARERLGWQPQHRLYDTLEEIIARLEYDPQRWYKINNLGEPPADKLGTVVVRPTANEDRRARS